MPIINTNDSPILATTPYRATLTSFGSEADGKAIKRTPFTLQGTSNGSSWTTIAADQYRVRRKSGYVERRDVDDSGNDTDWTAYSDYQDLGNQAFRVTYTVIDGTTTTVYTNEVLTFAEVDPYVSVSDDGSVGGELIQNLYVDEIHAELGFIGGWVIGATTLTGGNTPDQLILDSAGDYRIQAGIRSTYGSGTYGTSLYGPSPFRVSKTGGMYAIYGEIGGWTIGASTLSSGGMSFDSASEQIVVGSTSPKIIIDGYYKSIQSSDFASGVRGFAINTRTADAEFNNLTLRGALRASVFKVSELTATAGTFGVFYSASTIYEDFTTPASTSSSFTFKAKDTDAGLPLFSVNDIIRIKTYTGSGISDVWATITARSLDTGFTTYTATLESGSTSATIVAGTAVVDYGPSGTGFITLSTDGTVGSSPNLNMATHAGSPWSAQTNLLRLGNLNGSYGYSSDVYGFGTGQYGAASKAAITVDQTSGIRIINNTTVVGQWDTSGNATFGNVATSQANMFWDNSAKQLKFRAGTSGTTVSSFVDTDGKFVFVAASAATDTPILEWRTAGGVKAGNVSAYIDSVNDVGIAFISSYGTSGGDVGYTNVVANNRTSSKYSYFQVTSDGTCLLNMKTAKVITQDNTRLEIQGASSDNTHVSTVLSLHCDVGGGGSMGTGFGPRLSFSGDGNYQGDVSGKYIGGGNHDLVVAAAYQLQFVQGTPPTHSGSWGGNAAGKNLAALLATMGLINDTSTA